MISTQTDQDQVLIEDPDVGSHRDYFDALALNTAVTVEKSLDCCLSDVTDLLAVASACLSIVPLEDFRLDGNKLVGRIFMGNFFK